MAQEALISDILMSLIPSAMSNKTVVQQIIQAPNVLGYVHCSAAGDVLVQEGNEVDVLANVLIYFQQVATLIGDSFGLEDFCEAQVYGKSLIVICMPCQNGAIGAILNSRAQVTEVTNLMRQILQNI